MFYNWSVFIRKIVEPPVADSREMADESQGSHEKGSSMPPFLTPNLRYQNSVTDSAVVH